MKVYVDELPKLCSYCPFYYRNSQGAVCKLSGFMARYDDEILGKMRDKCPFQSLADYTKQVRKEVVQEIKKWAEETTEYLDLDDSYDVGYNGAISNLCLVLDKIEQGETK